MIVTLPISKSIANRLLIGKAMRGDDISDVVSSAHFGSYPDDVRVLATSLCALQKASASQQAPVSSQVPASPQASVSPQFPVSPQAIVSSQDPVSSQVPVSVDVDNCGTAMRFLTAYAASCPGLEVVLTGCKRMQERPIGQLVDALRSLGADIEYMGQEGYPPLRIVGRPLSLNRQVVMSAPRSTQFVSALLLIGADVVTDNTSPYISLTRAVMRDLSAGNLSSLDEVEGDWSAAAFWLERDALGLLSAEDTDSLSTANSLLTADSLSADDTDSLSDMPSVLRVSPSLAFTNLRADSLQGDRVALDLFQQIRDRSFTEWDFSACPDLFPAAAVACARLGLHPRFTGTESLRIKESDRLEAVADGIRRMENHSFPVSSYADHRIAMAFLAADCPVDDTACIDKSYPAFLSQLLNLTRVVAVREGDPMPVFHDGLLTICRSDEGKGKKHALLAAMPAVTTDYVWLTDADIVAPSNYLSTILSSPRADMLILPLRMRPSDGRDTLLARLQILEYAAIQSLTMRAADQGRAVMCAGANMLVNRAAWLRCAEEIRPEIPSGDDMFMLEAMKRHGYTIRALDSPSLTASCSTAPSLGALLRQRMRWAGKAPHYTDRDIIRCGIWTLVSNLLVVLCPLWMLGKWIADMCLIRRRMAADGRPLTLRLVLDGLLLTAVYPWYMLICLVGGLFRRQW